MPLGNVGGIASCFSPMTVFMPPSFVMQWQAGVGRSSLPRFLAKIAIYLFSYDRPPNPHAMPLGNVGGIAEISEVFS